MSYKPTYRKHEHARPLWPLLVLLALVLLCVFGIQACIQSSNSTPSESADTVSDPALQSLRPASFPSKIAGADESIDENGIVHGLTAEGISYTIHGREVPAESPEKVRLCAVGDQIATSMSFPIADRYGGEAGDGLYDFTPFYREIAPLIQSHDLRYINQETVMAGTDNGRVYSGYPVFNSPDAMAEAIASVGFNLVNFATNHSYDMGAYGIERSHEVWDRFPELLVGGSYLTQEERETVHMIERNGFTFAFLAYTYGDNAGEEALANDYYSCQFDKELIERDVKRAQQVADVTIVSMHWGSEYISESNDQQYEYAAFLADLNVDLVLGTHAHIMQPVKYITGESGNTIPVVFGLSDIVSGWTITDTILSGVFSCDFVLNEAQDGLLVENLVWYPAIEWSDGGDTYVRLLKDMDEATINANTRTEDVADDSVYLRDKVNSVGMEIPVEM
jgi:hypothetical protein